jgi:hypothetical protein
VLLFLYRGAHALGNTFSMAVLARTNWLWLVAYLLADHCGLLLYKLARGDLVYYVPGLGVPLPLIARFVVKVIVDFTGYALPVEIYLRLGFRPHTGRSLSICKQQVGCFVAGVFFSATRLTWAAFTYLSTP